MLAAMFKASPSAKVLFLDFHPDGAGSLRKLDGIRRFAKTHGWDVLPIPPDESQPAQVKPLLTRHRPVGCIVEGAGSDIYLPPRLFGKVPVVYLDPPNPTARRTAAAIVCDNAAVARLAFRELSAGMHPCLAVVPSFRLRPWDAARIRTFRALCADAEIPCKVFGAIRYETGERLVARLADWLVRLPKRSGLFATNDKAALDVVKAARKAMRNIPRELTVIGVDDLPESDGPASTPSVSSIRLDLELAGYLAAKKLAALLSRRGDQATPETFGPLCVLRRESTRGPGRREPRILEAVEIIRREVGEGLTAAALAARFQGSRKHFERRFREAMGHSVLNEILHMRMSMVLDLLSRPDMRIGAIADFCGFESQRALRKLFRSRFGMSMEEWRAQRQ